MKLAAQPGTVYLAGAGPGDPSLLTLRALRLLETADVILPDGLVSDEVLALAGKKARIIPVGKRSGNPSIAQEEIHALMLEHACAGSSVLRLKSGDPLVFGRAGEEIAALEEASIPFEIVPGITAAFAAAASLKTPLTNRNGASKLILATAHFAAGKLTPSPVWQGVFPEESTLAIYMPGRDFGALAENLISSGIPPSTRCLAVSKATTACQSVAETTLKDIGTAEIGPAPVILLIGQALHWAGYQRATEADNDSDLI